ncbi:MAG: hypothetical protein ABGW69_00510 [Nanoarchaeota archaeon]
MNKKSTFTGYLYVIAIIITAIFFYWIVKEWFLPFFTNSILTNQTQEVNRLIINLSNDTIKTYNISTIGLAEECHYSISQNKLYCWKTPVTVEFKEVPDTSEIYSFILYPIFVLPIITVIYLLFKIE